MTWIVSGLVVTLAAAALYRTFGWIRIEEPLVEQRRRAFEGMSRRYRRTHDPIPFKLRLLRVVKRAA